MSMETGKIVGTVAAVAFILGMGGVLTEHAIPLWRLALLFVETGTDF